MSYRKYGNQRHNGKASKKEADVGQKLSILQAAGKIQDLREQVAFDLLPAIGKQKPVRYVADFVFTENGKQVVMDAKGCRTAVYKLKKRMMLQLLGIEIEEV